MTRISWILTWALQVLRIFTLIGSFLATYVTFNLKMYKWGIFHDKEKWCKWKSEKWKVRLVVWKMTWGIWLAFTRALESLKIRLWWDPFIQRRKCMSLKIYRGVMYHGNETWCNVWREIDVLILTRGIWRIVTRVLKMSFFMSSFWKKYVMFELKR